LAKTEHLIHVADVMPSIYAQAEAVVIGGLVSYAWWQLPTCGVSGFARGPEREFVDVA
jgi:hypothetical protein